MKVEEREEGGREKREGENSQLANIRQGTPV